MKKKLHYLLILFLAVSLGSCSKEGAVGPTGLQGAQGPQGTEGKQGVPGTDGNMIHYGTTAPVTSVGNEGDFYINTSTSILYGPKTKTAWGTSINLKGETGARGATGAKGDKGDTGAAGSQFLSGTSNPTLNQGKAGDFYFNITSGTLFGPKTSTWSAGINLKGLKGDKGDKGATGEKGERGERGERGPAGQDGKDGNVNIVSSGWHTFKADKWHESWASGSAVFSAPGDVKTFYASGFDANYTFNTNGVVLLYIDDSNGIKLAPFRTNRGVGSNRAVEFRMVFNLTNPTYTSSVYPVVALTSGTWDSQDMINDYLVNIKWKLIVIPEMIAKAQATTLKSLDLNDHEAVTKLFKLTN